MTSLPPPLPAGSAAPPPPAFAPTDIEAPSAPEPAMAVRTDALTKRYGSLVAVASLELVVPAGSVFGLIGPNGAGKSTTLAMLASLLRPTAGSMEVLGIDPTEEPGALRGRLGYMPDVLGVYDNLRVDEYLLFFAAAYRLPRATWPAVVDGLLDLVDLGGKRESMVNSLSRGMKQRLSLARALVHDPELLILDEPASGLDPRARVDLRSLLMELQAMGKTIIISSHILPELQEMCSDVAIMESGHLLASGPPDHILEQLGEVRRVRVRFADGTTATFDVPDEAAQAAVLRRLIVDEGRDVVEYAAERADLEDLFLAVTTGAVQ
jgi:ABC-2 type transport system ATP-binding protein